MQPSSEYVEISIRLDQRNPELRQRTIALARIFREIGIA